jgi:hypothetical protein
MMTIEHEHLKVVSYLDLSRLGDRAVNLIPLWDGEQWHLWVQGPNGLIDIHPVDAMQADYVAKAPARTTDLLIPFVDLMWQRASWPETCSLIAAICDDFHNMGTSLAKLRHIFFARHSIGDATSSFATTELEYILVLARTIFDLLQEIIARIWQTRVRLKDPEAERIRRARALPETFSKIVLRNKDMLRSPGEIANDFHLPANMASAYAAHAPFFAQLRTMRDSIVHGGKVVGHVFATPRGFCVSPTEAPFRSFHGWTQSYQYNENLSSLLPWVGWVVLETIGACNSLVNELARSIELLPEIAPGYNVYVRGPSNVAVIDILKVHQGSNPWWDLTDAELAAEDMALQERIRTRAYFLWLNQSSENRQDAESNWRTAEQLERSVSAG